MPVNEMVWLLLDSTPVPGLIELIRNPVGAAEATIRNELMFEFPFGVSFLSVTAMLAVPAVSVVGNLRLNCFSGAGVAGHPQKPPAQGDQTTPDHALRTRR